MEDKFKTIDECFTCDCHGRDVCLVATICDDRMIILDMVDETLINIPWYTRLRRSLAIFWDAFWNHSHSIELILNRQEHRKFKLFVSNLQDERCWNCDPDYLVKGSGYYKHSH
jgi:hypothetical protein